MMQPKRHHPLHYIGDENWVEDEKKSIFKMSMGIFGEQKL